MNFSVRSAALFGAGVFASLTVAVAHANLPTSTQPLPPIIPHTTATLCTCQQNVSDPSDVSEAGGHTVVALDAEGARESCEQNYWANLAQSYTDSGYIFNWVTKNVTEIEPFLWQCKAEYRIGKDLVTTFTPPTTQEDACNALVSTNVSDPMPRWEQCWVTPL